MRRAPLQYHTATTTSGANEGGCAKPRKRPAWSALTPSKTRCVFPLISFCWIIEIDCDS
jgi:hypothetical protein